MFTAERGKEMKKYAFIAIALLLLPLTLFASGATEEKSEYVFATDATWPPFEYIDEAGNLTGFEVELVPMIGEAVGKTFVVQNIPWDTIFAGLRNGQYDGVASGVTITEERKATIDFSTPINNQGQVLIIPAAKSAEIQSIDDLPEGAKVGVQIGTTGDFALESYPVEIRRYDDIGVILSSLLISCSRMRTTLLFSQLLESRSHLKRLQSVFRREIQNFSTSSMKVYRFSWTMESLMPSKQSGESSDKFQAQRSSEIADDLFLCKFTI